MFELSDWQRRAATQRFIDQALIGGRQRPAASGATFDAIDPASNRLLARVAACDAADVDAAVAAARRAFDEGPWARLAPVERKRVLLRLAELMLAHREELALLDSLNMGKPVMDAWNIDVPGAAHVFAWYAESLDKLYDQVAPTAQQALATITRVPLGVIGAVVPWNFPLDMAAWKLAPALAAGNSVVLKPAEQSPFSALRLAELALEAGVPEGVLNVVPGLGEQAGKALGLHPEVDALVFTGSTEVGKYFMRYSAQSNLKQVWLECGGKSPNLVFADCRDLDLAAEKAAFGIFFNQGEVCSANSRLLVERSIHDEFVERLLAKARDWQPGDPLDPASRAGAIVDRRQTAGILAAIERAQGEGATLLGGGRQLTINGSDNFIEPTLFRRRTPGHAAGPRGNLRSGAGDQRLRLRGRGHPPGQRQPLRPRRLAVERRPAPCAPGGAALECRNGVGEYRGRAGRRGAFRRRQAVRLRSRPVAAFLRQVHPVEDDLVPVALKTRRTRHDSMPITTTRGRSNERHAERA